MRNEYDPNRLGFRFVHMRKHYTPPKQRGIVHGIGLCLGYALSFVMAAAIGVMLAF
jgi:hypothetical protein